MLQATKKRKRTEAEVSVVLRVENMVIENWESKKFWRGKGDEKVCYDVQYVSRPERPHGVVPWKVGWYSEVYEHCNDVDRYGFNARHAKTSEEYDTLIVKLRNPGSFRQYKKMNYYHRKIEGGDVKYVDMLTKKIDPSVTYGYLSECAAEKRLRSVSVELMPTLAYGLRGVQHHQWEEDFKIWKLAHKIKLWELGLVSKLVLKK